MPGKRARGKASDKGPDNRSKLSKKAVKKSTVTLAKKGLEQQEPVTGLASGMFGHSVSSASQDR